MHFRIPLIVLLTLLANPVFAEYNFQYEVTITNITRGQTFTPQLVATHNRSIRLFTPGDSAGEALEILAEAGDTGPLTDELVALGPHVGSVETIPGLLGPGESASVVIRARPYHRFLSVAAMLIPTNDTFVGLTRVRLPRNGVNVYTALGYDAGTELNDQNCANIPGPRCGGAPHSPGPNDGDEGFVYVSNGFHDLGESDAEGNEILGPLVYDWRNPVARVVVKRLR